MSRRDFWELIHRIAHEGTTVVLTTHYMDEAERCHRLSFIFRGRLLDVGCAAGFLLEVARERGWDVQGVELNPECASALAPDLRGRVAYTTLAWAKLEGRFALITLFDML